MIVTSAMQMRCMRTGSRGAHLPRSTQRGSIMARSMRILAYSDRRTPPMGRGCNSSPSPAEKTGFFPMPLWKLTDLQAQAKALRDAGKTRKQIAAEMGVAPMMISKHLAAVKRKEAGLMRTRSECGNGSGDAVERKFPQAGVAILAALADPLNVTRAAAIRRANEELQKAGIPASVSDSVMKRMTAKYADGITPLKEMKTAEILEMVGKKLDLCDVYLDDKVMAEASARDIMLGMGVLMEKRQLLRGEPTAIVSHEDRAKLSDLLPALVAEARRRGVTVEGEVIEKVVSAAP